MDGVLRCQKEIHEFRLVFIDVAVHNKSVDPTLSKLNVADLLVVVIDIVRSRLDFAVGRDRNAIVERLSFGKVNVSVVLRLWLNPFGPQD